MATIKVEYIGNKAIKEDNVSDSGATWEGPGDIQEVTPAQWGKLSKHPGVWRRVDKPVYSASHPLTTAPAVQDVSQSVEDIQIPASQPEPDMVVGGEHGQVDKINASNAASTPARGRRRAHEGSN